MNTGTNYIHLIARLRDRDSIAANGLFHCVPAMREAADAIEKALPAINAWTNPDALRTRIVVLTQNPYSPTDSVDSPQPEDK